MKHFLVIGCVALAGLGLSVMPGCEREIAQEREVEVDNGERTERETTVREGNDGVEVEERERHVEEDDGLTVDEEVEIEQYD